MTEPSSAPDGSAFDIGKIRQLVRLMRENDLAEIDLRWQNSRVRLRRGPDPSASPVMYAAAPLPPAPPARVASDASDPAGPTTPAGTASHLATINCPIVGTFYASSGPDAEPFVRVGSKVVPTSVVCIVEAMKVFNEIPAGLSGTIAEILVENGAAVEYGQALFRIQP